LVQA